MSSPPGAKVNIDKICQDYELEISGVLLTMDLIFMDMLEFDVILGMDWLTSYRVFINCDRKRVSSYTFDGTCFMF